MITVDRLYVRYDDTNILEDINLNLPTGITCAVIGLLVVGNLPY